MIKQLLYRGKPFVLGLVGAIGAGKSTVAKLFAERGFTVIDGDLVGHEVLRQSAIRDQLVSLFGAEILDGTNDIDRKKLGRIVFADMSNLEQLEAIVHPLIRAVFAKQIAASTAANERLLVIDAAVLIEAGWHDMCDLICFVDAPRDVRLERLKQSRGWTDEELRRREAAQMPLDEKRPQTQLLLLNDGSPDECRNQVNWIISKITDGSSTQGVN